MPKFRVFAFALACCIAAPAQAVTIDFEDIGRKGGFAHYDDSGFSTEGFDFHLSHGHHIDNEFLFIEGYASTNGTDWLMHDDLGDMTVSAGGATFELAAVDAGQYRNKKNSEDIQVTGHRQDGSTIAQSIISKSGFQTISFSGWTNLVRLTFSGNGYGTYDNFVLKTVSTTAVPVPSPLLMMASALGLLGFARYRNNSKRAKC